MSPSRLFILRPVATTLLMAAILLVGIVAYRFLPISALPEVDYPTIQVQTFYPGASPEVMTSSVTSPLEVQFGQMPGLNQMFSTSSAGASVITLQFSLDLSLDIAEQEVQAAINAAGNLLPSDLPAPPIYAKVNPADAPILTLALTSKTLPLTDVEDIGNTRLAQKISQQPGVGLVTISGGQVPAVRVQINPRALAAYGLNIDDLRTTLGNANTNTPKGNFNGPAQASTINANDQITDASQYLNVVIAYRNGDPVRLKDVASVLNGAGEHQARRLGQPHARGDPEHPAPARRQRHPGGGHHQGAAAAAAGHPARGGGRRRADRPHHDDPRLGHRRGVRTRPRRRPGRAGDLPVPAQPAGHDHPQPVGAAVAGRHAGDHVLARLQPGQPVADGSDDLHRLRGGRRHRHDRERRPLSSKPAKSPMQAALKGSEQIGFTIISLTVSLIAVLIPLLFMGDVVGRLFHEFAITLSVTIVISAVVSLTLVPMMCARLVRHRPDAQRTRFDLAAERGFNWVIGRYDRGAERGARPPDR